MSSKPGSGLKHILFATDFSPRSDRAGRRAVLLAKQFAARLTLVHVVDDDQPNRLIKRARADASRVLAKMRQTFLDVDGIDCETSLTMGEAFAGTLSLSADVGADMIVIGPHRRQILKDVFTGTTAERIIRQSVRPVLMVNGTPAGPYRHVLVATDMSECSLAALRACRQFKLGEAASITVAHVFDTPAKGHMRRAFVANDDVADYVSEVQQHAEGELRDFLQKQSFRPDGIKLCAGEASAAVEIRNMAKDLCGRLGCHWDARADRHVKSAFGQRRGRAIAQF